MTLTLKTAVSRYGSEAKAKLGNVAVSGEPEDQLRAPLEGLLANLAELCGFPANAVAAVEADEGAGAVPPAIEAAVSRLVAFEMQLGPFAVAQLRIHAELLQLTGKPPKTPPAQARWPARPRDTNLECALTDASSVIQRPTTARV